MENLNLSNKCSSCEDENSIKKGEKAPVCCEKAMVMEPLPFCTSAPHYEMTRNNTGDEPCDDGRGSI
jgi:hypothetical protein